MDGMIKDMIVEEASSTERKASESVNYLTLFAQMIGFSNT